MKPSAKLRNGSDLAKAQPAPVMPFQKRCREQPISKRWILLPDVDEQHPLRQWQSIAQSDHHVLLTGEAGVGLEDLAVLIADNQIRPLTKFCSINCAHYSESALDQEFFGNSNPRILTAMNGGTIFIDELDQAEELFQAKLLRLLERGEYQSLGSNQATQTNVRMIVATQSKQSLMSNLQDQFGSVIDVPPLRERPRDIIRLLLRFLWPYEIYTAISPQLLLALTCYSWPGNVRELEALCRRVQSALPIATSGAPYILSYAPVEEDYQGFPKLPRNEMLATIRTMLMLYALRRHLGLEPTELRWDETNHTLRLLLEIEAEHVGHHPNLSFEKIEQCWELPALYDLSNFDSAEPTPNPEYGSLSLPSVLELLRDYCCQSNAGPGAALELLLERQGPDHQPDIQHWEFMNAEYYMDPPPKDDPLQKAWGIVLPPTEEQKRYAETLRQLATKIASEITPPELRPVPVPQSVSEPPPVKPLRINIKELAKQLGKSERTIAEWKLLRKIPFEKIGRNVLFDVADVDLALKKFRRNAAGD